LKAIDLVCRNFRKRAAEADNHPHFEPYSEGRFWHKAVTLLNRKFHKSIFAALSIGSS
jgi:hypothetical protein